ncbi:MAG TPA: 50S ribosomal protein L6 [Candidatus Hydrogenedentes bacterium]|nr:50S ribosomal protein L6 [Candidatus Hydrogenedentota bacterium]HIJ73790.1 50S ribosomal protein L6 [Candidatus Hydrogenedentota bacterium]
MSRIGKLPVPLPSGVTCELAGSRLRVTGPKGTLERTFNPEIGIDVGDAQIAVTRPDDQPDHRALHGLTRALVSNMVTGVTQGFKKSLEIVGVGFRASMQGKALNLVLGFSHPVLIEPPEGVTFSVEGPQSITVSGIDKQLVGQTAANIRALRKPEPYKGKGIRYKDEHVRRKVGKAGVK